MAVSDRTGRRRLLKLADLLEKDAKNKKGMKFDIRLVAEPSSGFPAHPGFEPSVSCGTVGCAMGLAAASGAFKGLSFKTDVFTVQDREFAHVNMTLNGRLISFHKAAMKIFRIDNDSVRFLFTPDTYRNKSNQQVVVKGASGELRVAKRIRNFVAGKLDPLVDFTS